MHDAGLRRNGHMVANLEVARDADLPGQGCVMADLGAARNPHLRHH